MPFLFEERDYQRAAVDEVLKHFRNGKESVLLESPVGSGKTVMGLLVIQALQEASPELRVNWVACRKHILEQTREINDAYFHCSLRYVSVFCDDPPEADMVILDEAHHEATQSCVDMYEKTKNRLTLGLSATPLRTDRMRLSFQNDVLCCGIPQLISMGVLAPFDSYKLPVWNLELVEKVFCADPAKWGKTLAFFSRIDECRHFQRAAEKVGVRCEVVTGASNKDKQLALFAAGDVQVIANVSVLCEGFDLPEIQTVFVRDASRLPTIQMAGRGLRRSPAKEACFFVQSAGSRYAVERIAHPRQSFRYQREKWLSCGGNTQIILSTAEETLHRLESRKIELPKYLSAGPFVREVKIR